MNTKNAAIMSVALLNSDANKKYNIIYADPPWSFNNKKTGGSMSSGASQKYDTMEMYQMAGMILNTDPVVMLSDVIADDCYQR